MDRMLEVDKLKLAACN